MWRVFGILVLFVPLGISSNARAADEAIHYDVQLIRGTDSDQAPQEGGRKASPELVARFRRMLKCKHYWEICRTNATVFPDAKTRVLLSNGREVEIDLTASNKRTVTVFQNRQELGRHVVPRGEAVTLIGGDRDKTSIWVIQVRRQESKNKKGI